MSSRASGNTLQGTWSYNDGTTGNQRLFEAHVWNGANALSALQTSWGPAGNLTRRTNWALPGGGVEDLTFGYDTRNRLVSAATTSGGYGGGYRASYAYDASGRMTLKDEPGAAVTLTYSASGPAHAPKTVNGQAMQYDAHGNLTQGRDRTFTYDGLQRTKTVTANGLTTTSWYGADGRPVLRDELTASGTITKTLLIDTLFEVDVTPNGSNAGATTSYYFFGGQRVAQREQTTGSAPTLRFLHGDHLGSQGLVTDSSGNEVSRLSYLPYGGTRLGSQTGAFGFTDQRLERQHGLHYYGNQTGYGRFYDSGIGAWTQADPLVPGTDAVAWNRFSYVYGNPLRFKDPTGHDPFKSDEWKLREEQIRAQGGSPDDLDRRMFLFEMSWRGEQAHEFFARFYGIRDADQRRGILNDLMRSLPPASRSWHSLPDAIAELSRLYDVNEGELLVLDIGFLYAGYGFRAGRADPGRPFKDLTPRLLVDGLDSAYQDADDDGNVHHWAGFLYVGYFHGPEQGRFGVDIHEGFITVPFLGRISVGTVNEPDVRLGYVAVDMGYGFRGRQPWELAGMVRALLSR